MLNQACKIHPMNLQLFAEAAPEAGMAVDDGSDMFLAEPTSEAPKQEPSEPKAEEPKAPKEPDAPKDGKKDEPKETPKETPKDKKEDAKEAPKDQPATIRVKYNGEERDIPITEAPPLLQKGLNYEKVTQRVKELEELAHSDIVQEIDKWAKQTGMSPKDFMKALSGQREQAAVNAAMQRIQEEFPDMPEAAALELAKARAADARKQEDETASKAAEAEKAEKLKPWMDFTQKYGIKDAAEIPPDVLNAMASGTPPIQAMQEYKIAELEKKVKEIEEKAATETKNQDNKKKSTGSAASKGSESPPDAFLLGLTKG